MVCFGVIWVCVVCCRVSVCEWPCGLVVWFSLWVREVPGSIPGRAHLFFPHQPPQSQRDHSHINDYTLYRTIVQTRFLFVELRMSSSKWETTCIYRFAENRAEVIENDVNFSLCDRQSQATHGTERLQMYSLTPHKQEISKRERRSGSVRNSSWHYWLSLS